jgi:hypothetical protein
MIRQLKEGSIKQMGIVAIPFSKPTPRKYLASIALLEKDAEINPLGAKPTLLYVDGNKVLACIFVKLCSERYAEYENEITIMTLKSHRRQGLMSTLMDEFENMVFCGYIKRANADIVTEDSAAFFNERLMWYTDGLIYSISYDPKAIYQMGWPKETLNEIKSKKSIWKISKKTMLEYAS